MFYDSRFTGLMHCEEPGEAAGIVPAVSYPFNHVLIIANVTIAKMAVIHSPWKENWMTLHIILIFL